MKKTVFFSLLLLTTGQMLFGAASSNPYFMSTGVKAFYRIH
jgi:hypothetical protein